MLGNLRPISAQTSSFVQLLARFVSVLKLRLPTCQLMATSAIWVLALCGTASTPHSAEATPLGVVSSRSAFDNYGPFVPVNWGVFGPAGTAISTPAFQTVDGITVGVGSSQGELLRQNEGSSFIGDFAVGADLLTDDRSKSDTFMVSFGAPVFGFGMQIEPDYIRGVWTGDITVFSSTNVLLGDIPISGNATNSENDSAPFYGVADFDFGASPNVGISYARIFVDQGPPLGRAGAVAINTMDVNSSGLIVGLIVPEPSSLVTLATAILFLFGIIGFRRARYRVF